MKYKLSNDVVALVLSAGRGTRLGATNMPKVMFKLNGKPMLAYTVQTLQALGLSAWQICLVVGFCKEKIMKYFKNNVCYAEQKYKLGTAHATYCGIISLPEHVKTVLVLGGDDSAFYKNITLYNFIEKHKQSNAILSLLSVEVDDPSLLGRVIRNTDGTLKCVVEKENIIDKQKNINEVSTGTFCFNRHWFESMYPNMPILPRLNEYGLPTAIDIAREQGKKLQVIKMNDPNEWFGVNTPEQLEEAQKRMNTYLNIA